MQPASLDRLDWQIIEMLSENGRVANSAIGEKLGVTEGTIRQRIRRLMEVGVLRISGQVNPEFLEGHQLLLVGVNVGESSQLMKVFERLGQLPEVKSVAVLSGRYDLIIQVVVESNHGVIKFLSESLARIEGIRATETFIVLKTHNYWL
ncbi:MAG: hypothetical protein RL095_761 [Verrucomicrobiota bacterium]|jgi:Lrp/AsnC family transcriptional regulator for asnA, asnC and gidA